MIDSSSLAEVFGNIAKRARAHNAVQEGDYRGKDGLLYCGKCNTPKECRLDVQGSEIVVACTCQCVSDQHDLEVARMKERDKQRRIAKLRKSSLMDEKFMSCTFETTVETPDNKRQIEVSKRYAEKFDQLIERNQGLLFYGDVGTGKTHLACCIGNYLIDRLHSVFATSLVKILQQTTMFSNEHEKERFFDTLTSASLVILDDLGAERSTEYAQEIVYNVIDSRYRSGKPMIVTTNLPLSQMTNATDVRLSRIYDRIFEVCYPVSFTGVSLRKRDAAARYDEMTELLEGDV